MKCRSQQLLLPEIKKKHHDDGRYESVKYKRSFGTTDTYFSTMKPILDQTHFHNGDWNGEGSRKTSKIHMTTNYLIK